MTMDRTVPYGGGGHCPLGKPPAQIPIGWQRKIHHGGVVYISPSGSVLACLEQAKSYLQTDGTCKCGLECPLILHKVFNFDPGAVVAQRTAEDVKADSAVTKLCIHKRKIIAVATLHRSVEAQVSSRSSGGCHMGSLTPQAIRKDLRNGPSNSVPLDGASSYKLPLTGPQHYAHKHQLGSPPQRDAYAHQSRLRPGAGDHNTQRSPYRSNHHSSLLSPPATTTCSAQHYGDRTPFLRSPESAALGFHRALSPGHVNGERFGPLSPPSVMVHGPPSSSQLSCALAGRTSVSSSPSMNTKSPNRQRSPCGFPQNTDYPHKSPSSANTQQQHPIPQHTPYIVQKRCMSSSEKDPLGILDPIPSFHGQAVPTPSRLQVNSQPQVASVHAPPTVVPLLSNLPMPVVKSGVVGPGPGPRVQQHPALSSISSSPVRSPVNMAVPTAPIRLKESSLHPHTSVSSSHYGSVTLAAQASSQQPSRSLQGPVSSSPKNSVPLHHMAESVIQPLVAINTGGSMHSESVRLPPPRSDGVNPTRLTLKTAPRQLDRQIPPTFPASSLLSAAAKAQLVHQNNLGGSSGHPGLVGGGRQPYGDVCGGLEPQYLCGSGVPLSEGRSGRAALRDKLMSQQRGAMRKRKPPGETDGDMSFHMNTPHGPSPHGYPAATKRLLPQGVATNDASMAPLVQPIGHQVEAQNGLSHACQPPSSSGKPLFFEESVPSMSNMQNVHGPLHLQSRDITGYRNCRDDRGEPLNVEQFAHHGNQTHNLPFVGNMRTISYGGHEVEGSMCNQNSQQPQMGHHVKQSQGSLSFKEGTGFPPVMSNGGFEMYPESGKACFRDSVSRKAQNGSQRRRQQKRQPKDSSGQLPVPAVDFLQCPESLSCSDSNHHPRSPGSMNGLLRTFKASLAERIPHPASMVTAQSQGVGLPDAMCFQASQQEFAMAQDGHHRTEANPTGQQVRAGSRGESASSVIVRNRAFPVSQAAPPLELSQSVIHVPPHSYPEEPARHLARARRTPAKLKQVNGLSSAPDASLHLGRAMQVGQWSANGNGGPQHRLCQDERGVLQARAQDVNGNGVYAEFLARHAFPTPQEQIPAQLNGNHPRNGLLSQVRSGGHTSGSVIQSPEHYPASDGRRAYFPKRSDGYLNGQLNGNYGGREEGSLNGSFVLNITEGQTHEERLGAISLHHPGRPLAHRQLPGGDLLWPGAPSFHPWQSKMKIEGPAYLCSVGEMMPSKVEPVRFHQALKDDLDTLHKANGIHLSAGAVSDRMEDAVHDAMDHWNKFTANVGLDGVWKPPNAKKRKIFR